MELRLKHSHEWKLKPAEAKLVQEELRQYLCLDDAYGEIKTAAGVDLGFEDKGATCRTAVVVLDFPSLQLRETAITRVPTEFPYVPGYLSFREIPGVLSALAELSELPDMILCDGQGYAHPRRMGIATHLGIITDIPTIGVAKSRLIGTHGELGPEKGDWTPLLHEEEVIGALLRTRTNVNPLYISSGHRVSLESAISITLACTTKYKLPETTRYAHHLASDLGKIEDVLSKRK